MAISIDSMREFAANAAQAAASKTRELASVAKANLAILAEEDKVKKAQLELGKIYYRNFISDEEADPAEYLPLCEKITESLRKIDGLKAEIEDVKSAGQADEETDFTENVIEAEPEAESEAEPEVPVIPEIVVVEDESEPEAPTE